MESMFLVKKPVSLWNKPLRAEWRGLFQSLSGATAHLLGQSWTDLVNDAAGAVTSLGLDTSADERAWLLIRRALTRAVLELVREHGLHGMAARDAAVPKELAERLDAELDRTELAIGTDFLDRPGNLAILDTTGRLLAEWLREWGKGNGRAEVVTGRLRAYFVHGLGQEWRQNRRFYEPILHELEDTPFAAAGDRQRAWQENAARLLRQVNEPMFGEPFGLEQIFVRPRGAIAAGHSRRFPDPEPADRGNRRRVVELGPHLEEWLAAMDRRDPIRVLSGGPGSGKSSFARMLAAEQAAAGGLVILVPLYELDLGDSLPEAMDRYLERLGLAPLAGLLRPEHARDRLLLIFDGLDELSIRGRLGAETALQFVRQMERAAADMNRDRCRLQVLITGRELAVQATENELSGPDKIIHILPYYLPPDSRDRFHDPDDLLVQDQRDMWWARYAWAAGIPDVAGMPRELGRDDLRDITAEPLLCYLVALSYLGKRIDFTDQVNLCAIYDDLLRSVYHRGYDSAGRHAGAGDLREDEFIEVLEEIGLAAWHGSGRVVTVAEIHKYCERSARLKKLMARFEKDAEAGITGLLLAFYFRHGARTAAGDPTFEFTHKSFAEYLTARRVVRGVRRMTEQLDAGDRGDENGWDEREALKHWAELCGPSAMGWELLRFVRGEVLRWPGEVSRWQAACARLFGRMLRAGMPMDLLPRQPYRQEAEHAGNAEIALLVAMNTCARATGERSRVPGGWPAPESFGSWLAAAQNREPAGFVSVVRQSLSWLELDKVLLEVANLYEADLECADLSQAALIYACLVGANLRGARLEGAFCNCAILRGANLTGANLDHVNLRNSIMDSTNCPRVSLQGANLNEAVLTGADLRAADLRNARLQDADLRCANLTNALLCNANIAGANLTGANLADADLTGVRWSDSTRWPIGFDPNSIPQS